MPYVRTRLGRLFFEERGASAPSGRKTLVFLHGILFDGGMWRSQLEALSHFGRAVVFDGPGHGKSDPPPRFSLEEHADALHDAFGELGIDSAVVCGHSWGGMTAIRLALQHPSSVAALALVDSSAEAEPRRRRVRYRAFASLHRRLGFPRALYDWEIAPLLFGPGTLRDRPELARAAYERVVGFDREGVARAVVAAVVHRRDVTGKLSNVHVPCLVLCGTDDRATPVEKSKRLAAAIGGAELRLIEGAGHMSPLERPTVVSENLAEFVARTLR